MLSQLLMLTEAQGLTLSCCLVVFAQLCTNLM